MTIELKEALERRLDEAIASKDPEKIADAHTAIEKAMIDCQMKTAERVKDLCKKMDSAMDMVQGARLAGKFAYSIIGAGGGALLCKLITVLFGGA